MIFFFDGADLGLYMEILLIIPNIIYSVTPKYSDAKRKTKKGRYIRLRPMAMASVEKTLQWHATA